MGRSCSIGLEFKFQNLGFGRVVKCLLTAQKFHFGLENASFSNSLFGAKSESCADVSTVSVRLADIETQILRRFTQFAQSIAFLRIRVA